MKRGRSISFPTYLIAAAIAIVSPFLLLPISVTGAAIAGLVIAGLWLVLMPHGCLSGAFVCFPITMVQIGLGIMWAIRLCTM